MHVKRQAIEKSWPIPRKGTKYIIVASHNKKAGLPVLIILRDLLRAAKNRKEVKKILQEKKVSLNGIVVRKEQLSVAPYEVIKIGSRSYELIFSNKGKFMLKETPREEQILKIINKKNLKGNKIQLNLIHGKNIIYEGKSKIKTGDSVVIEKKKIAKVIPLENNREAVIFAGRYRGRTGKIEKIENKIATLSHEREKINVPIKNILVIR